MEPLNWRWNRAYIPPFLTVGLQQDYVTQITDVGWLESCLIVDINNSTNSGLAPKPSYNLETMRDLLPTWQQRTPYQISYIPNRLAILGQWYPNTKYPCGYGQSMTQVSPIQQFMDDNGNILFIDSTVLGLNPNSLGFSGTPITLPPNSPYGVSGDTKPSAPVNAAAGTTVQDGTVVWTVADPNGYAIRTNPLPPVNGLCWLVMPVYQMKAPNITSLQQTIAPIPDEYGFLFRDGLLALLYGHVGSKQFPIAYQKWEESIQVARRGADRENESFSLIPSGGTFGGQSTGTPIGLGTSAAWPYGPIY
jgi:hypothetical protein